MQEENLINQEDKKLNITALLMLFAIISITLCSLMYNYVQHQEIKEKRKTINNLEKENKSFKAKKNLKKLKKQQIDYLTNRITYLDLIIIEI